MEKPWLEGKMKSSIHPEMDKWLSAVDKLSRAISELKAAKERFKNKITGAKKIEIKKPAKPESKKPDDKKTEVKKSDDKKKKAQEKTENKKEKIKKIDIVDSIEKKDDVKVASKKKNKEKN